MNKMRGRNPLYNRWRNETTFRVSFFLTDRWHLGGKKPHQNQSSTGIGRLQMGNLMDLILLGHVMIGYDKIIESWISADLGLGYWCPKASSCNSPCYTLLITPSCLYELSRMIRFGLVISCYKKMLSRVGYSRSCLKTRCTHG